MVRRSMTLLAALVMTAAITPRSDATLYTLAGFSFDTANLPDSAGGTYVQTNSANMPAAILSGPGEGALSFGSLLDGSTSVRRATVGSNVSRDVVTLEYTGALHLPNGAGDDIAVFEQGSQNIPEAFAIAVRLSGQATFSPFIYNVWDAQEAGTSGAYIFGTGFDLSDFGVPLGATIDAIQIMNLVNNTSLDVIDYTLNGGEGEVLTAGTPAPLGYARPLGYGAAKDQIFPNGEHDPDFTLVAGLQNLTAVPESSSVLFVSLAAGLAWFRARRRV